MATFQASTLTPLPVRERIKDLVAQTLCGITVANGYTQTVTDVYRHQNATVQLKGFPSISIVDRGDRDTRLVQGIYEAKILLELRTVIEDFDRENLRQEISQLSADCMKAAMTQERPPLNVWGGLAVQTLIQSADLHTSDAADPYGMVFLMIEIMYRVQQGNPYQVALI
jgi:hypothetical protein